MAVDEKSSKRSKQMEKTYDPALTQLFASSFGPTRTLSRSQNDVPNSLVPLHKNGLGADILRTQLATELVMVKENMKNRRQDRKRKRKDAEDDIEGRYMRQIVLENARDKENLVTASKDQRSTEESPEVRAQDEESRSPVEDLETEGMSTEEVQGAGSFGDEPPQHEAIASHAKDSELEKSSRTVFLANVSTSAIVNKTAKKDLMDHLASILPTLPKSNTTHALESLRFRSTAFADSGKPKKAAFVKKELMETTTRSTNAYAVYTSQAAAREAAKKLNGTMVLDRHLRVDSVAHPAKQDHRRCVFVGNLGFVDDVTAIDAAKDEDSNRKPRKGKEPADIEEGLWRHFGKAGAVESVRVVRDKTTRVGKGFAYVQFWDSNAVEKALAFNERKFPPMLPRILRVVRAKSVMKLKSPYEDQSKRLVGKPGLRKWLKEKGKPSIGLKSLAGRANKLLGRAGRAQANPSQGKQKKPTRSSNRRATKFKISAQEKAT